MRNEYLFSTRFKVSELKALLPEGVSIKTRTIKDKKSWIAIFTVSKNDEAGAKKLAEVNMAISKYSPLELLCESSEFFNKSLFPLVNQFERKLRKLLYLAAYISDNADAQGNVKQLEKKDLGEIFDILFIDPNFNEDAKRAAVGDNRSSFTSKNGFTKAEFSKFLATLSEDILWDKILSGQVPTLRKQFRDVQAYRNSVMHAHNIDADHFTAARRLFRKINKELDSAITVIQDDSLAHNPDTNIAISSALAIADLTVITDSLKSIYQAAAIPPQSSVAAMAGIKAIIGANSAFAADMRNAQAGIAQSFLKAMPPASLTAISGAAISEAAKRVVAVSNPSLSAAVKSFAALQTYPAFSETLRKATALHTPATAGLRKQLDQANAVVLEYKEVTDSLSPYAELQETLRIAAESMPDEEPGEAASDNEDEAESEPLS